MSADTPAARRTRQARPKPAPEPAPVPAEVETDALPRLPAGWRIVAIKEFADHILSVRFFVLLLVLGLAAAIPLYFAADQIRSVAPQASGTRAVFLALFWFGSPDISILTVATFVAIVAPLLGLAFAFDAVNGERSEGTLPRLLSQPIYRDDVINGKFAAGLAVIGLVLVAVVLLISGFGMLRLGIVPHGEEVIRLVAWVLATFLYVALWLAFGLLLSVAVRRAATSALIGFGIWLVVHDLRAAHRDAGPGVHHAGRRTPPTTRSWARCRCASSSRGCCRASSTPTSRTCCCDRTSGSRTSRPRARSGSTSRASSRSPGSTRSTRACCSSGRRWSCWSR